VIHIVKMIGPWNFEIELVAKNYQEYNNIINDIKEKFYDIVDKIQSTIMNEVILFPSNKIITD
jgi:hypothetical protein